MMGGPVIVHPVRVVGQGSESRLNNFINLLSLLYYFGDGIQVTGGCFD